MLKKLGLLFLVALLVAWAFDFLFWGKPVGISFALFCLLCLAGGFFLSWQEHLRLAPTSLLLILPILFFLGMTVIRQEPLTSFMNVVLALFLMALLAQTLLGGRWMTYSFSDYLVNALRLGGDAISRPFIALDRSRKEAAYHKPPQKVNPWRKALPVLRGLVLAIPVWLVLASLLSSADPIFGRGLADFLAIFRLEKLPEYLVRFTYILILGYLLAGIYLHALEARGERALLGLEKPWLPAFLGFIEAATILGGVILLFGAFVGVQFRYFFGGQANIHLAGYTYSEYARRGFAELVIVAVLSLLLFLGLSWITKRENTGHKRLFSALGILLTLLVMIILVSAFQRLLLYEQAYGFTRLRTYPHIFMIWLGILLISLIILELVGRLRYFALAALLCVTGFAITLNVINVDRLIARQNLTRTASGVELDSSYFNSLSADAIPILVKEYQRSAPHADIHAELKWVLSCHYAQADLNAASAPWQAYHWSKTNAHTLLRALHQAGELSPASQDEYGRWTVPFGSEERLCQDYSID